METSIYVKFKQQPKDRKYTYLIVQVTKKN